MPLSPPLSHHPSLSFLATALSVSLSLSQKLQHSLFSHTIIIFFFFLFPFPPSFSTFMAVLVLAMLFLAMATHSSANWCVCKDGLSDAVLQKTLDYACGAGADCNPIHTTGGCYQPNTVRAHCSYAVNSYFQKKGQASGTCDFAGTATISSSDPSSASCAYPATTSTAGNTTPTPVTTTPGTTTPVTTTPTTTTPSTTPTTASPYTGTPSTGVLGGIGTGVGPSGVNTDYSHGGLRLENTSLLLFFVILLSSGLMVF